MSKERSQAERQPRKRQITEEAFRLALHYAAKNADGNEAVLCLINELLKDLNRYQQMNVRVIFWEQGGNLWLEPKPKGEIGFRRYGKRGRV